MVVSTSSKKMNVLSVVCARRGSKGLLNKCVTDVGGRMLAQYAIDYSLSLGENVRTVVSTDIDDLIRYCEDRGVTILRRNPAYCSDESKIDDALAEAIEQYGDGCELCSLVYGNIPTRYSHLFEDAVAALSEDVPYDAAMSMQNVEKYHPAWMFDYDADYLPRVKQVHYRRQMLPQKMIHDGHTIVFRIDGFMKRYKGVVSYEQAYKYSIFGSTIKPLINDRLIIDIDTEKDLKLAAAVLSTK